jgi:hypothetical protein
MQKFKQYRFLKKVEKLLNKPAPADEVYDSTMDSMYVGASAPRTAGHFADSTVSVRQGQVKRIAEMLLVVVDSMEKGGEEEEKVEPKFIELDVCFQELDLGLLFTQREKIERSWKAAARRKERAQGVRELERKELDAMRGQIAQWQKEQLEKKRRLYQIETMVRDLGVNINDVRCRALGRDRKVALANLKGSTDSGVRMLRKIMERLGGVSTAESA